MQKKLYVTVLCSEMVNILGVAPSSSRCGLMILVWHFENLEKSFCFELHKKEILVKNIIKAPRLIRF